MGGRLRVQYVIFLERLTPTKELFIPLNNKQNSKEFFNEFDKIFYNKENRVLTLIGENSLYQVVNCNLKDGYSYKIFIFKDVFTNILSNFLEDKKIPFITEVFILESISCRCFKENRNVNFRLLQDIIIRKLREYPEKKSLERLLNIISLRIKDIRDKDDKINCNVNCVCANWYCPKRIRRN